MPKLSSTNRGLSGKRQEDSEDERNASATKRQGVATDGKRFDKLQSDILKIEAKLNSVEDPQK
jgi:predicted  nucleic acid-binding Zn-ribbon protein